MYEWCVYTRLPRCYMKSKLWYDGLSYHFIEPPIIEIRMNSSYETFAAHRQTEKVNWRARDSNFVKRKWIAPTLIDGFRGLFMLPRTSAVRPTEPDFTGKQSINQSINQSFNFDQIWDWLFDEIE